MESWNQLVAKLPEEAVATALTICHDLEFERGETIMSAGEQDPALIYVTSGEVEVRRAGVQLAVCGPGQLLGEMGLFREAPRTAEVVTREPTRAFVLTHAGYRALVDANNPVVFRIERQILEQLGQRMRRMDRMLSANAPGEADPFRKPPKAFFDQIRDLLLGEPIPPAIHRGIDPEKVLEASHLFRGERFTIIQGLVPYLEPEQFAAGEVICEQGEPEGPIHVLAAGAAQVVVRIDDERVHQLGTVGPGSCVGMSSLVDGRRRLASVVALEQVDALTLPRDRYLALVRKDGQIPSGLRRAMIRAFANQVEEAGAALVAIARGDLPSAVSAVATEIYGR